jgi:ribonuclease P/MRP protein subunit POP7
MSAVKRVGKAVDRAIDAAGRKTSRGRTNKASREVSTSAYGSNRQAAGQDQDAGEVAVVLATGRAIEKALGLATWFERRGDCQVGLRTRSVAAVDDVIMPETSDMDDENDDQTRIRMVSCLEVGVRLR